MTTDLSTIGVVPMPYMWLSWSDADPVANCGCGWRSVGDSINDAVLAWTKHVTQKHREEW